MIGGKGQSLSRPTAAGTLVSASPYGQTIPQICGMTKTVLLPIWANGLRQGASGKKGKGKKGEPPTYVENVDFLVGHNPIIALCQAWNNNNVKAPLNSVKLVDSTIVVPATYTISDSYFYYLIGVTATSTYSFAFNDYGSQGSVTQSGTWEVPLWNEYLIGPNPTRPMGPRVYPLVYRWQPSDGTTVTFPTGGTAGDGFPFSISALNFYYYQLSATLKHSSPLSVLRLSFESVLGSGGTEYNNYPTQQITYPQYAGAGSPNIDMGFTGMIPQIRVEAASSSSRYPTGDCDFADMIETVAASGPVQAGLSATSVANVPTQVGLGMYDMPGPIQHRILGYNGGLGNPTGLRFLRPNTVGNLLLFFWCAQSSGTPTGILDSAGNSWTTIDAGTLGTLFWIYGYAFCTVPNIAQNFVQPQVGGNYGSLNFMELLEVPGVDSYDTSAASTVTGASPWDGVSLTTGNTRGNADFVFAAAMGGNAITRTDPLWSTPISEYFGITSFRKVIAPTSVAWRVTGSATSRVILASFKATKPASYPAPYGQLLDKPSLDLCRQQCRANGLWGSVSMDSQRKAVEWLKDFYFSADTAPGFTGHKLYSFPRSEASMAGNGVKFTSLTSGGPVANLSDLNGDFVGTPPVTLEHSPQFGLPNIIQIQHINRSSDYQQVTTSEVESAADIVLGVRKASPLVHPEIQDVTVARKLVQIEGLRNQYVLPWTYKFKLQPRWDLLSLYDLVTITDSQAGISNLPVRLTEVTYCADGTVDCQAERFVYGVHAPSAVAGQATTPYTGPQNSDPGSVNAPIIFEPPLRMTDNVPELWIVVSGSSANYGGCIPNLSVDGGTTYQTLQGTALENGITGHTTADYPATGGNPDATDTLSVDLTESNGILQSFTADERDNFQSICYLSGPQYPTPTIVGSAHYYSPSPPGSAPSGIQISVAYSGSGSFFLPSDAVFYFMRYRGSPLKGVTWYGIVGQSGLTTFTTYLGNHINTSSLQINWSGLFIAPGPDTDKPILYGPSGSANLEGFKTMYSVFNGGDLADDLEVSIVIVRNAVINTAHFEWALTGVSPMTNAVTTYSYSQPVTTTGWLSQMIQLDPLAPGSAPLLLQFSASDALATWGSLPSGYTAIISSTAHVQLNSASGVPTTPQGVYELIAYGTATQTGTNAYNMGGAGGAVAVQRSVFNVPPITPQASPGIDHPSTSRFAFVGPPEADSLNGVLKLKMDPKWIAQGLWFKFQAMNSLVGNLQNLSDCVAYEYTPTGAMIPSPSYSVTPQPVFGLAITGSYGAGTMIAKLTPLTAYTQISFADTGQTVTYYGIGDDTLYDQPGGGSPPSGTATVYAFIFDPRQIGGTLSGSNTIFSTTTSYLGSFGYWYLGAYVIDYTNFPTITLTATAPGGWPQGGPTLETNGQTNQLQGVLNVQAGQGVTVTQSPSGPVISASVSGLRTISGNDTLVSTDGTIQVVTGGSTITFSLMDGTTLVANPKFTIAKIDSGTGSVSITPFSGQTINGQATWNLDNQWQEITIQWDGTSNWLITGNN